jgi:AcrR family transcriptional regulator
MSGIPEEFRRPEPDTPRARILEAAASHFAANGFAGSTTRAIAESAGVNQAMIHYYFQSKTRLYERVLGGIVVELLSSLAESMAPRSDSPAEVLVHLPERIVAVFAADPVRTNIFRREIGDGAPHMRAVVDRLGAVGPRGFRDIMSAYIKDAGDEGEIAPEPASTILPFILVHAYGTLLVEPMIQHVFGHADEETGITDMMTSQRDLLRRALTGGSREEDE